jgi:hypothetical protein
MEACSIGCYGPPVRQTQKVDRAEGSLQLTPMRWLSPDWFITGVNPKAAPTALEVLKRVGMSMVLLNASESWTMTARESASKQRDEEIVEHLHQPRRML